MNDVDETKELVSYSILNQNVFHSHILLGAQGASVSDTLTLFYWGYIEEPVKSLSLNALNPESDQRQCAGILSKMAI